MFVGIALKINLMVIVILYTSKILFKKFNTEVSIINYCSSTTMMNYFNAHWNMVQTPSK